MPRKPVDAKSNSKTTSRKRRSSASNSKLTSDVEAVPVADPANYPIVVPFPKPVKKLPTILTFRDGCKQQRITKSEVEMYVDATSRFNDQFLASINTVKRQWCGTANRPGRTGVKGVSLGPELTKKGKLTGNPALYVFVERKIEASLLSVNRLFPTEHIGLRVHVFERSFEFAADTLGGDPIAPKNNPLGTVGLLCDLGGRFTYLTAGHVVQASQAGIELVDGTPGDVVIARTLNNTCLTESTIDAAFVEANPVPRLATIRGFEGYPRIVGSARWGQTLSMFSRRMGTINHGFVVDTNFTVTLGTQTMQGQILISPSSAGQPFALRGDSGSAVVNTFTGEFVGILIGTDVMLATTAGTVSNFSVVCPADRIQSRFGFSLLQ